MAVIAVPTPERFVAAVKISCFVSILAFKIFDAILV